MFFRPRISRITRIDPFGGQVTTGEAEDGGVVEADDLLAFCGLDGLREGTALAEESERLDDGGIVLIEIFGPSLLVAVSYTHLTLPTKA